MPGDSSVSVMRRLKSAGSAAVRTPCARANVRKSSRLIGKEEKPQVYQNALRGRRLGFWSLAGGFDG